MQSSRQEQPLLILAQYIKDLSFENPNAPDIYGQLKEHPAEVTVNVDLVPTHLGERTYEVVLTLRIQAMSGDNVAFLTELDYAGIISIGEELNDEETEQQVFCETPRHLFPFARNIVADATRDASFPPVVINPIDFASYYEKHKKDTLKTTAAGVDAIQAAASDAS